jgi:hypothetical protein
MGCQHFGNPQGLSDSTLAIVHICLQIAIHAEAEPPPPI